jgi:hypothetical protein
LASPRGRPAPLHVPSGERDPAAWLASAERLEETAARQERDLHGRGVDHDFVRQLRGQARFALRRAEELLAEERRPRWCVLACGSENER